MPRWTTFVLPFIVGLAAGLFCVILWARNGLCIDTCFSDAEISSITGDARVRDVDIQAPPVTLNSSGEGGKDIIYILGSGTVYRYLISADPDIFKNLREKENIHVELLEGPTDTGASVFTHAFNQLRHPVLVMASKKLPIEQLSQSAEKPRAVFEAYLGADALQMLLVMGEGHPQHASALQDKNNSALEEAFPDIFPLRTAEGKLRFTSLTDKGTKWIPVEKQPSDGVYVGSEGSGTINWWKTHLGTAWPQDEQFEFWDIRNPEQILALTSANRIYLGSEVLNAAPAATLNRAGFFHARLTMIDKASDDVRRGLYLYGVLDVEKRPTQYGEEFGYDLPESVARLLKYVFNSLKGRKPNLLGKECYDAQMGYFHLNAKKSSEAGWINVPTTQVKPRKYEVGPCTGRPQEIAEDAKR